MDKIVLQNIKRKHLPVDTGRKLNVHKTFRRRSSSCSKSACLFFDAYVRGNVISLSYSLIFYTRGKCPKTELFLVGIFLYAVLIQEDTDQK